MNLTLSWMCSGGSGYCTLPWAISSVLMLFAAPNPEKQWCRGCMGVARAS